MNLPVRSTLNIPALVSEFDLHVEVSSDRFEVTLIHQVGEGFHTIETGWISHLDPVQQAMDRPEER